MCRFGLYFPILQYSHALLRYSLFNIGTYIAYLRYPQPQKRNQSRLQVSGATKYKFLKLKTL